MEADKSKKSQVASSDVVGSMSFEKNRLKTYKDWPFQSDCYCTPEKMAEAGFYYSPTEREPDLVKCYICCKELDGWDPNDDPWAEHKVHSKHCPFVLLNKKQSEITLKEYIKLECQRHVNLMKELGENMLNVLEARHSELRRKIQNM